MKAFAWALFVFALIGFFDSLYLSWGALTGNPLSCGILEGCNIVARNPFSRVFNIPLAVYGAVYYLGALGLSASLIWAPFRSARVLMILWAGVGVLFSAYFLYLQAYVILAFCIYCLISAVATIALLALSLFLPHEQKTRF